MTADEVFAQFKALPEDQSDEFLHVLGLYLLLHLPDAKCILLDIEEYVKLERQAQLYKAVKHLVDPGV